MSANANTLVCIGGVCENVRVSVYVSESVHTCDCQSVSMWECVGVFS